MMQAFPKIYMLSTVGIRQHYHQDYPIHALRTDFAGKNAIGKSIIADLLQLIFIQERSIIRFGTDSLDNKSRKIETIPYKHKQGYAYLTIEVAKDKFIAIGVCIPTSTNNPIIPFIISKHENIEDGSIEAISYSKEQLIKSNHLLSEGTVLPVQEMSRYIRDQYNLRLIPFRGRSEVREYQSFLKNRRILPINLLNESNLKSFARILQSFSRAKDFTPSDPKKLKDFLFDEVAEEYFKDFKQHQSELEDQLKNYRELNKHNENISIQRWDLTALKLKEDDKIESELIWRKVDITMLQKSFRDHNNEIKVLINSISAKEIKHKALPIKIKRLNERLIPLSKELAQYADQHYSLLAKCSELVLNIRQLDENREQLQNIIVPDLSNFSFEDPIGFDDISISTLKQKTEFLTSLLKDYSSLAEIEQKLFEQEKLIQELSTEINQKVAGSKDLLQIVKNNTPNTLFSKVLENGVPLSAEQESVLFHLIDAKWGKPDEFKLNTKFITDLAVLDSSFIIKEQSAPNSIWFTSGYINELVKLRREPQLLDKKERLLTAREAMSHIIEKELKSLNDIEKELDKVKSGKPYNQSILKTPFNILLVNKIQFEEIKKDVAIVSSINARIKQTQSQKDQLILDLENRLGYLVDIKFIERFETEIDFWEIIRKRKANRVEALNSYMTECTISYNKLSSDLETLQNKLFTEEEESSNRLKEISAKQLEFESFCRLHNIGQYQVDQLKELEESLTDLETQFSDKRKSYEQEYYKLAYPYTHTGASLYNAEIDEQVKKGTYNFRILESIMLNGIGLLEEVESYITNLNTRRIECRRTIYEQIKGLFYKTSESYKNHKSLVGNLNIFFQGKPINKVYRFKIEFTEMCVSDGTPMINWLNQIQKESALVFESNELQLGKSVDEFVESFYKKISNEVQVRPIRDLLDPKSYFNLKTYLVDKNGMEASGSTGQTYTSIVLLCIGRISIIDKDREGIKFIILEETASIDDENFELVMQIASDFGYQVLTMTPKPYGISSSSEWYLHQLVEGKEDRCINYPMIVSYLRSNTTNNAI